MIYEGVYVYDDAVKPIKRRIRVSLGGGSAEWRSFYCTGTEAVILLLRC